MSRSIADCREADPGPNGLAARESFVPWRKPALTTTSHQTRKGPVVRDGTRRPTRFYGCRGQCVIACKSRTKLKNDKFRRPRASELGFRSDNLPICCALRRFCRHAGHSMDFDQGTPRGVNGTPNGKMGIRCPDAAGGTADRRRSVPAGRNPALAGRARRRPGERSWSPTAVPCRWRRGRPCRP